jgi:hypothetical protein
VAAPWDSLVEWSCGDKERQGVGGEGRRKGEKKIYMALGMAWGCQAQITKAEGVSPDKLHLRHQTSRETRAQHWVPR